MSKTDTVSPLRQRMIEDMATRKLRPLQAPRHKTLRNVASPRRSMLASEAGEGRQRQRVNHVSYGSF